MNGDSEVQQHGADLLAKYRVTGAELGPCVSSSEKPAMLRLCSERGSVWSFPYGSIRSLRCKGNSSVILESGPYTVRITGLRLRPVFDSLCTLTIGVIQAGVPVNGEEAPDCPVIDTIRVFDHEMSDVTD